ncbi:MAG: hypothetical protein Q4E53_10710 [Eubacteriales bacterium]|nr:hypothetical protein [Eubacteriales bacterium]
MFEMFITIVAAVAMSIYGLSKSVFMNGPYQEEFRIGLLILIVVIILYAIIRINVRNNRIRGMNVNLDDYLYYEKYTSFIYRIGYFISYLIQNILFDYVYMKRNFNFCKGLDVYDGGVSEYYIKFRNTWYKYLSLTIKRHRVSLKKLQAFAAVMKNEMIFNALPDEETKAYYRLFEHEARACFDETHSVTSEQISKFESYKFVNKTYRKHVLKHYKVLLYVEKHEPRIKELINLQDFRSKRDVNDYKKMDFR